MSMSRYNIDPVEIESESENGDTISTYIFDVSDHMLAGEVCTGLALALAEVLERDPARITPLSSVVDCDALQLLFHTRRYGDLRDEVSVSFPYDVYEVTVHSSGRVVVQG
ncbi:HalOD1 output domain-containing protein [Halorussus salinisoli]|uniref:HalOD1 output domain-containing protein n=1 Tax=Halorussus salinisoli TaxID=2558242 RepID=UPI002A90C734|nr:HalOD1 output domain-containing protein [Halorussus salinisoli]